MSEQETQGKDETFAKIERLREETRKPLSWPQKIRRLVSRILILETQAGIIILLLTILAVALIYGGLYSWVGWITFFS